MDKEIFYKINRIIERDSKTTTYKFALLRGIIDIIQDNSPYISHIDKKVIIPVGMLIEKWLIYYYPLIDSKEYIPQINGKSQIAFYSQFQKVINYYRTRGGLSAFYNDLRNKGISSDIKFEFILLSKKLKETIIKMPMKYIGRSISSHYYSIFKIENNVNRCRSESIDTKFLIDRFGKFSIPFDYYEAFRILGSFLTGQDSILFKWAEFSVNASNNNLSTELIINEILKNPVTERDVNSSKSLYKSILRDSGEIACVWTGARITNYDIDHLIPFCIWKNNDLWNLLPSKKETNNRKRDKIPSPILLEKQKDLIIHYWEVIREHQLERFLKEIKISLLGENESVNWKNNAFNQLKKNCYYLINTRGFEEWKI